MISATALKELLDVRNLARKGSHQAHRREAEPIASRALPGGGGGLANHKTKIGKELIGLKKGRTAKKGKESGAV